MFPQNILKILFLRKPQLLGQTLNFLIKRGKIMVEKICHNFSKTIHRPIFSEKFRYPILVGDFFKIKKLKQHQLNP